MSSQLVASNTFTLSNTGPQIVPVSDEGTTHLLVRASAAGVYIGFGAAAGENFFSELPASGFELLANKEYEFTLGPGVGVQQGTDPNDTNPYLATQSDTPITVSIFATTVF